MGRLAEVNIPCLLEVKTWDGDSTRTIQARVYNEAGTEQAGSPFTPTHFARGNYKTLSWTPTVQGYYIVNYEVFVDAGCITLDTNYVQFSEVIFVRSTLRAIYDGLVQSGSTSTTVKLDTGASSINDFYKGGLIQVLDIPTGISQSRVITAYDGTTKVATVGSAWATTPDSTCLFSILPWDSTAAVADKTGYSLTPAEHTLISGDVWNANRSSYQTAGSFGLSNQLTLDGTAAASGASTITLDGSASATANLYNGNLIYIYSGTGSGQTRIISSYSSGKVATVSQPWTTALDGTSKYIVVSTRNALLGSDGKVLVSDGSISNATFAAGAIDANALNASAATEIATSVASTLFVNPANKLFTDASGNVSIAQVFPTNFASMLINGTGQITVGTNADKTDYTLTGAEHTAISGDVWNAARSSYQLAGSFGVSNQVSRDATAQAGSTSTTIRLDASASSVDNFYNNSIVFIMAGTGSGQSKLIKSYSGTSKDATVDSDWVITPDNTSKFTIIPFGSVAYQIFDKVIDVKTFAQVQEIILAYATGKIVRTGNEYEYQKQDNITPIFTLQSNPGDRIRL